MRYKVALLIAFLLLAGCTYQSLQVQDTTSDSLTVTTMPETSETISTPDLSSDTEVGTQVKISPTASIPSVEDPGQMTSESVQTQNTPVGTVSSLPLNELRTCITPPEEFYFRDTGIDWISQIRFESDDLIAFEGWGTRQTADVQPVTPFPTFEPGPNPHGANVELKAGQIDLLSGVVSSREIDYPPLNNPCNGSCPLQVLTTSGDQHWQLIQISDWTDELVGIWLVSENEMVRLLPFIPTDSNWSWAQDNTLLWYRYNAPEFRMGTQIVELEPAVVVHDLGTGPSDPQDAAYFYTAFSPIDKTVLSTENPFVQGFPDDDLVYVTELGSYPYITQVLEIIPGVIDIVWNNATSSFLYSVFSQTTTEYRLQSAGSVVNVPIEEPQTLRDSLGNDISQLNALPASAISASGTKLASVLQTGYVLVYTCP